MIGTIRAATPGDLPEIITLCVEHAQYEKAEIDVALLENALGAFLFAPQPRAFCIVASMHDALVAYATWSREFSTWRAAEYAHMDCLYVKAEHRNAGIGRRLLDVVRRDAGAAGCRLIEWQTPQWNSDAIRFYERCGAKAMPKIRFRDLI